MKLVVYHTRESAYTRVHGQTHTASKSCLTRCKYYTVYRARVRSTAGEGRSCRQSIPRCRAWQAMSAYGPRLTRATTALRSRGQPWSLVGVRGKSFSRKILPLFKPVIVEVTFATNYINIATGNRRCSSCTLKTTIRRRATVLFCRTVFRGSIRLSQVRNISSSTIIIDLIKHCKFSITVITKLITHKMPQ